MMDPIPGYQIGPSNEEMFGLNFQHADSQFRSINEMSSARDDSSERPYLIADVSTDNSIEDASSSNLSSSDLHICSVLDFYLSENVSALHFDSLMGFSNDATSYQSYQYHHWDMNMFFDMDERNSLFPFQNGNSSGGNEEGVDDTSLYLQSGNGIGGCLGDLELIPGDLPDLLEVDSGVKSVGHKHVTLVLDLDETLVHSTLTPCVDADFSFEVYADMKKHTVYVKKRPHLQHFLEKVVQMFEIVIFTASQSSYASKLLDQLDPDGRLFSRRVYRDSCLFFGEGNYTKDLTILGVDLAKVAIIDNLPQVYRLQEDNGIPIESWFEDPSDNALIELLPFLETLADAEDVRPLISQKFGTNRQQNV
ncbi:hypothetical protein LUZ61_014207 [Rhynchospora tenuis]|uniref:FCP1 homology domain-containing protein n=1 Tax=Rhynchospora tenuis TaxID=198213 RepID=A0AAD5Z1H7_9POAL|nr:hypothetical protein LUZ61_014207 [Rhynchospora tenuis]